MKIVLNPEYKFLQQFVQDLPTRFASEGKVIQDKRNTIKSIRIQRIRNKRKTLQSSYTHQSDRIPFFQKIKSGQSLFQLFRSPETGV